jgi:putative heme transporter
MADDATGEHGSSAGTRFRSALPTLARAGTVAWRIVGIGLVVAFAFLLFLRLRLVFLPLIVALFVSTMLEPFASRLKRAGWPPLLAAWTVFVAVIALVAGLLLLIVPQTVGQFEQLGEDLERSVREIEDWLVDGPLGLREDQVSAYTDQIVERLTGDGGEVTSRVIAGAQAAAEVLAGVALTGVLVFFFIKDGDRICAWALAHVGPHRRALAQASARRAWETLAGYLRGTAITGSVDAVFIGLGLALLGVPLVVPLALLTFFGAFFPVIGAPLAGLVAVLVALVSGGLGTALAVLALVFVVQQVESYLLAPSIMGRMVRLHPVVVMVVLTTGGVLAGIIGAFLAVPITAVTVAVVGEVRRHEAAMALPPGDGVPPGDTPPPATGVP